MWKIFDFVPGVLWAALLAIAVAAATVNQVRISGYKGQIAEIKAQAAEAAKQAEASARAKERQMQTEVERITEDAYKKQQELAARVAATSASVISLRDTIARLNARPAPSGPGAAAFAGEARTARELLGSCSAEYRSLAQDADGLRDQVIGLQQYITSISR
jgi:ATPase subunit of ABC transporter with duplicated ATPase domains